MNPQKIEGCFISDGWAGDLVFGSYNMDRELCDSGSIAWLNSTPSVWCLEW